MLGQKINKNRPNILQKTTLKTMPQLGWILVPTWLHFGRILGAKMAPSWVLIALKLKSKNYQKKDDLLNALKIDFGSQLGGAKGLPFRSLVGVLVPLGCLLEPRWPQGTSWDRFYKFLRANLVDFWSQVGGF